jgi:hypothetical protein
MKKDMKPSRRQFLKLGGAALAMIPVMTLSGNAMATVNAGMRASMKYQDKPNGAKHCAGCMQFVPGKSATAPGGCKIFAGDTEVSPNGYCVAWVAKPK